MALSAEVQFQRGNLKLCHPYKITLPSAKLRQDQAVPKKNRRAINVIFLFGHEQGGGGVRRACPERVAGPVWAVLNAVAPFGSEAEAAAETMAALDVRLCPAWFGRRVAFSRAVESGQAVQEVEPRSKAAQEVERLYGLVAAAL